jgi:hypothetical protein
VLLIEAADINDAEAILQLQRTAYQSEARIYNDFEIPPLIENLSQLKVLFANHTFLKATVDGKIVGSVRANIHNGSCHIGRLVVDPNY